MDLLADQLSGTDISFWGRNPTVGTTPWEDLTSYAQPTDWQGILTVTGTKLDISSSSTADTNTSGTGARKVRVVGLGAGGVFQSEIVSLNGQTIVETVGLYTDVFGADVVETGTGKVNAGDIHMVKDGTGGSYSGGVPGTLTSAICKILVGYNTEMLGHFTVPVNGGSYRVKHLCVSTYTQSAAICVAVRDPFSATDPGYHVLYVAGVGSAGQISADLSGLDLRVSAGQTVAIRSVGASASAVVQGNVCLRRI
jgi:hypothetical protein